MKQPIFVLSDGTGITAENLANSLMSQFGGIQFDKVIIPYVDNIEKAEATVKTINHCHEETHIKPIVFMTLVNPNIVSIIKQSNATIFDLFTIFIGPLEQELHAKSSYTVGKTHGVANNQIYTQRIEAVDFALVHDDGIKTSDYGKADIILIGVSRCGKTPSCLYLALHFGILVANYPFTDEDLHSFKLPEVLRPYKHRLFGLTIDPERLKDIRTVRRPNSRYASADQCRLEVVEVESMYQRENIPYLNSTNYSIEEISTKIMAASGLKRKF